MPTSALQVARTGLEAQDARMRVIAHNLANIGTTGFKRDRADFATLAYQERRAAGQTATDGIAYATGLNLGTGVQVQGTTRINTQGTLGVTGNAFDLALDGPGFFAVETGDGSIAYTRAGNFSLSADGTLVTAQGFAVQPQIAVPEGAQSVAVGPDGTVTAILPGEAEPAELGRIEIAAFPNPAGLRPGGDNLLYESAASGAAEAGAGGEAGRGSVRQGTLEASNVNVVEELVGMIEAQRAYEINSKMISAVDEMLRNANQTL